MLESRAEFEYKLNQMLAEWSCAGTTSLQK